MSRLGKRCHCVTLPVSIQPCKVTTLAEKKQMMGEKNETNLKTVTTVLVTKFLSDQSGDQFNSFFLIKKNRHRSMKFY